MAFHTRPSVGEHPYWHFHIEFYPIWRDRKTRKYLGGIETGGWTYMNDSTPEESAKELREVV
jgi:UDPglucose--hexose-1-phosphate uridylyltransferase